MLVYSLGYTDLLEAPPPFLKPFQKFGLVDLVTTDLRVQDTHQLSTQTGSKYTTRNYNRVAFADDNGRKKLRACSHLKVLVWTKNMPRKQILRWSAAVQVPFSPLIFSESKISIMMSDSDSRSEKTHFSHLSCVLTWVVSREETFYSYVLFTDLSMRSWCHFKTTISHNKMAPCRLHHCRKLDVHSIIISLLRNK